MSDTLSRLPRETALAIEPGSRVYTGYATAIKLDGVEGAVLCRSMADLKKLFAAMSGRPEFNEALVRPAALVGRNTLSLDDEL
jgi:hypothetical protein